MRLEEAADRVEEQQLNAVEPPAEPEGTFMNHEAVSLEEEEEEVALWWERWTDCLWWVVLQL